MLIKNKPNPRYMLCSEETAEGFIRNSRWNIVRYINIVFIKSQTVERSDQCKYKFPNMILLDVQTIHNKSRVIITDFTDFHDFITDSFHEHRIAL